MKIKNYLPLLPLMTLVASCNSSMYSFSLNDENKKDIYRNLDVEPTSYETSLIYEDANKIIDKLNNNEDVLLFLHQKTCSHCITLEPTFLSMQAKYQISINAFIDFMIREGTSILQSSLDYGPRLFKQLSTPALYLLSREDGFKIDLTGTYSDERKLEEAIGSYINLTNVYTSSSKLDFSNDGFYLLYKDEVPEVYYSLIKEKATSSTKLTYLYNVSSLSKEEIKNRFGTEFDSYSCLVKDNGVIKNSSTNNIEELVSTYYAS